MAAAGAAAVVRPATPAVLAAGRAVAATRAACKEPVHVLAVAAEGAVLGQYGGGGDDSEDGAEGEVTGRSTVPVWPSWPSSEPLISET